MKEILERIEKARFTTTDEVFLNRKKIRKYVQSFDLDTLQVYKWYFFFQLCLLKNPLKEKLWDYIVKERITIHEETDLVFEYRHYKEKCQKIMQNQKKEDEMQEIMNNITPKNTIRINSVDDLFKFD